MSFTKQIRPRDGFSHSPDGDVLYRGSNVQTHMKDNPNFPHPIVDPVTLKLALERFSSLIAETLNGGKQVFAEKNAQRQTVINMLRLLARYVEVTSDGDMAIFQTSGFDVVPAMRAKTPALTEKIRKIEHGADTGEIKVWLNRVKDASSYELRFATANNEAALSWTAKPASRIKTPLILTGLSPGATYLFQAHALVGETYTDWCDPVSFTST